jgi:hypothetical protein
MDGEDYELTACLGRYLLARFQKGFGSYIIATCDSAFGLIIFFLEQHSTMQLIEIQREDDLLLMAKIIADQS